MASIHPLLSVMTLSAAAFTNPAHALVDIVDIVEIGYGTFVDASTAGNCPSFCTGGAFASVEDGGAGITSAAASETTYGTARGSASFASGSSYLPMLKAYGSSGVGRRAGVSSFASQQFSYTGNDILQVSLDVNLTGSISNNASGYVSNTISASVAIVVADNIPWLPSYGSLVFEAVPSSVVDSGFVSLAGANATADSTTLTFTLNPGETFFVVSQLNVNAQNGVADAEHTLAMAFDPTTAAAQGLVAATAPVPEPGTVWFLAAGLLALGWRARRVLMRQR